MRRKDIFRWLRRLFLFFWFVRYGLFGKDFKFQVFIKVVILKKLIISACAVLQRRLPLGNSAPLMNYLLLETGFADSFLGLIFSIPVAFLHSLPLLTLRQRFHLFFKHLILLMKGAHLRLFSFREGALVFSFQGLWVPRVEVLSYWALLGVFSGKISVVDAIRSGICLKTASIFLSTILVSAENSIVHR